MGSLSSTSMGSLTVSVIKCAIAREPRALKSLTRVQGLPWLRFVVSNTLAKWKKLEPNEINFSQGFSQKVVSTSCFVFISLPARGDFCCLLITFANRLDPDKTQHNVGPDQDLIKLFDTRQC